MKSSNAYGNLRMVAQSLLITTFLTPVGSRAGYLIKSGGHRLLARSNSDAAIKPVPATPIPMAGQKAPLPPIILANPIKTIQVNHSDVSTTQELLPTSARFNSNKTTLVKANPQPRAELPTELLAPPGREFRETCESIKKSLTNQSSEEDMRTFQGIPGMAREERLFRLCEDPKNFCIYRSFGGEVEQFRAFSNRLN